mgnify:CR=1 FL=1
MNLEIYCFEWTYGNVHGPIQGVVGTFVAPVPSRAGGGGALDSRARSGLWLDFRLDRGLAPQKDLPWANASIHGSWAFLRRDGGDKPANQGVDMRFVGLQTLGNKEDRAPFGPTRKQEMKAGKAFNKMIFLSVMIIH